MKDTQRIQSQAKIGLFEEEISVYHNTQAVSSTLLRTFLKSPKRFKYMWEGQREFKETDAFNVGSALHCKVLEPNLFDKDFVQMKDFNRRTKAGREEYDLFKEKCSGRTILTSDQMTLVEQMASNINNDPAAKELLSDTQRELSARVKLSNDLLVQCRPDAIKPGHLIDVKTCSDVSRFEYELKAYGYHIQAAFYYFILSSILPEEYGDSNFYFIAVEKAAPYEVRLFGIDNLTLSMIVSDTIKPSFINLKNYLDDSSNNETYQEINWLNVF